MCMEIKGRVRVVRTSRETPPCEHAVQEGGDWYLTLGDGLSLTDLRADCLFVLIPPGVTQSRWETPHDLWTVELYDDYRE